MSNEDMVPRVVLYDYAMSFVGTPYKWGGDDPMGGIDCCLTADSLIYTPDGPRKIVEMRKGDEVFSIKDGKLVRRKVVGIHINGVKPVFEIKTTSSKLYATSNHRFLAIPPVEGSSPGWASRRKPEWVEVKDLAPNTPIVMGRNIGREMSDYPEINDHQLLFLGAMLGDGYYDPDGNGFKLCLVGDKKELLHEKYKQALISGFGYSNKISFHPSHGLIFNCSKTTKQINSMGFCGRSPERVLPSWVFHLSDRQVRVFLEGYLDTDGSRYERDSGESGYTLATSSKVLCDQLHELLLSRRFKVSNIYVNRRLRPIIIKGVEVKNAKPLYYFTANDSSVLLNPRRISEASRGDIQDDFVVSMIRKISAVGDRETYDLTIEDSHNYIANGFVVHNSGLVIELLQSVGLIKIGQDYSANQLYDRFKDFKVAAPVFGALAFYGSTKVTHVGFCLNNFHMLEAGGGTSATTDLNAAIKDNAFVKVRPIRTQNLVALCLPEYPWKG